MNEVSQSQLNALYQYGSVIALTAFTGAMCTVADKTESFMLYTVLPAIQSGVEFGIQNFSGPEATTLVSIAQAVYTSLAIMKTGGENFNFECSAAKIAYAITGTCGLLRGLRGGYNNNYGLTTAALSAIGIASLTAIEKMSKS